VELSERERLIEEIEMKLKIFLREIIRRPDLFQNLLKLSEEKITADKNEKRRKIFLPIISGRPARLKDLQEKYDELKRLYNKLMSMPVILSDNDIKHLCNNILHIVKEGGDKAWKCISIGSDLDGLIDSIDGCDNVTQYNTLAAKLETWIQRMAATAPGLPPITNLRQKVDDIMFRNAFNFLKTNFA